VQNNPGLAFIKKAFGIYFMEGFDMAMTMNKIDFKDFWDVNQMPNLDLIND